jgi:AAA+ superfamily predicted ATPase
MELVRCIAGVIMSRTALMFEEDFPNFWGEFSDLEKFCKDMSGKDYSEGRHGENYSRYEYITDVILKKNPVAQNVFDLSIAQMIFPKFGVILRRYTGYGACVENGCKLENKEYSIGEMFEIYRLLSVLFDTDDTASFFQTEHFCDNRLLAFLNAEDGCFMPRGARLVRADDYGGSKVTINFGERLIDDIVNAKPFGIVAREDSVDIDIVMPCAKCADKDMVNIDAAFLDNANCDKIVWRLVREAVLTGSGIFVSQINEGIYKNVVNSLIEWTSSYGIPWGVGIPRGVMQVMEYTDFRDIDIFYDKNLKKKKKINVPCGMLEEPDKFITMDDLIIPQKQKEILERICYHVRHEKKVYYDWGMDEKYRYGKGTPVLFAGPPGTGKTMAAHVLSNMLDIPLYKIDLSQVSDKYIGETEKHLQKVFEFADENETLLFFDEADALFGKRSEVKESKDRYANMEISYILQRIEQFDGIAILATNLRDNMDSAFIRRMKYIVDFPMPDACMREQIWRNSFAGGVPMGEIDFEYLARQFELSGGNIKNIILTATFLAAGRDEKVEMSHIFESVENEYFKYNKKMNVEDFGVYGYMFL